MWSCTRVYMLRYIGRVAFRIKWFHPAPSSWFIPHVISGKKSKSAQYCHLRFLVTHPLYIQCLVFVILKLSTVFSFFATGNTSYSCTSSAFHGDMWVPRPSGPPYEIGVDLTAHSPHSLKTYCRCQYPWPFRITQILH